LKSLRRDLLFASDDAFKYALLFGTASGFRNGELWLNISGNCIDIELNITWPTGVPVPDNFGSFGVKVLGSAPSSPKASSLGHEILISSHVDGAYDLQGIQLAPPGRTPRPESLVLRVLVDRSIVESFAQHGRASAVESMYLDGSDIALIWRSSVNTPNPVASIHVFAMRTGYVGEIESNRAPLASTSLYSAGYDKSVKKSAIAARVLLGVFCMCVLAGVLAIINRRIAGIATRERELFGSVRPSDSDVEKELLFGDKGMEQT